MTMPFAGIDDIEAFAKMPLAERLAGRDLVAMIKEQAARNADAVALRYLPSGRTGAPSAIITRRQLVDGAAAFAQQLADAGIVSGDVIASLLPNGPGTIAAALASVATGVLAPINYYLDQSQIRKLVRDCRAKVLLLPLQAPEALAATFSALRSDPEPGCTVVIVDTDGVGSGGNALPARMLNDRIAIFHTGGTTGLPKFVPLTALNLAAGAIISQFAYGYSAADSILCAMPMFHVGGLFACSLFPLAAGSTVTILGPLGYRGKDVLSSLPETMGETGITVLVGPPTVMAQIAAVPPQRMHAPGLRLFINGAAALPRSVGTRLAEQVGVPVVEPWGLTEATLAVTSGPRDGAIRQGSVGLALPYCEVKAVRTDDTGRMTGFCGTDEIGVLAVRGPMGFSGYLDRPPEAQPFFADGWLDTGDLGRVDADGFVWVTGRAKELIKRGGHGIDPGMIEDALNAHPGVALAAAIGRPDIYAGELPVAYVQLHPGATVTAAELLAFAGERIPERAAVPKDVLLLPALPLTAIGKVHKQTLKLDAVRRVVEDVARDVAGAEPIAIDVMPHPLHGFEAIVHVPASHVTTLRDRLAGFAFRSRTHPLENGDKN